MKLTDMGGYQRFIYKAKDKLTIRSFENGCYGLRAYHNVSTEKLEELEGEENGVKCYSWIHVVVENENGKDNMNIKLVKKENDKSFKIIFEFGNDIFFKKTFMVLVEELLDFAIDLDERRDVYLEIIKSPAVYRDEILNIIAEGLSNKIGGCYFCSNRFPAIHDYCKKNLSRLDDRSCVNLIKDWLDSEEKTNG